ncbi:MAG: alpha/beta fold hydrolase [Acidimicrobiales bacterium]|jgi:3-oxoadipate enol-lactonase
MAERSETITRIREAPELAPGRKLHLPGRGTIMVRDEGPRDGIPVVMSHGWTVTADLNYFAQYAELAKTYRVIAFDHAGHGSGLRPRGRVSVKRLSEDTIAVVDALGIDQFVMFGYSLGGTVAQLMARDHAHRMAGMVLSATRSRFRTSDLRVWPAIMATIAGAIRIAPQPLVDGVFTRILAKRTEGLHPWGTFQVSQHDPRSLIETGASLFNFDSTDWIRGIRIPTAVVITEDDDKIPAKAQRALADLILGASLHPTPGMHDAPLVVPETYNVALMQALDSVVSRL